METGGTSAIQIILWILIANIILILSVFGLVYWLRKQSQGAIRKIGAQIQEFDQQMGDLGQFLKSYTGIDQEPFFTPLEELQSEASQIEAQLHQFLTTCHIFEDEIHRPGSNQLQNIINAPFIWFRRWQQSRELRHQAEEIANQMRAAESRMERIFELPWELAAECRLAGKEVDELSQHVQWLQAKAVRGTAFNKVTSQLPLLNQGLDQVPAEYFEADKDRLLGAANLKTTIRVFEQLHTIRPAINRYLPQVREWRSSYEKATAEYAGLRQEGANLRQALASPPAGLLAEPIQERLDQVAQLASELNQRLTQPEAEQLKSLAREINHLHRVLQDTGQQFTRAGQQVIELNQALRQLQEGLDNLDAQFAKLEQAGRYPLVWDESRNKFEDLRSRFTGLGPIQQPRTPDQIQVQRGQADEILTDYKNLAEKTPAAVKQYAALVELLNSQPLQEGQTWLRQTREVIESVGRYDPKNWTKQDSLNTLPAELDELERLQTRLIPSDPGTPLQETQLSQRLKETQQLANLHKDLRPRAESIHSRLQKIQSLEKEGKEKLTGTWNVLERIAILAESNTLLDEIVSTEIDRLGEEVRMLANELNAHQQGEIEKKSQKIQAQVEKVNQLLNQWLASMNSTIADQVNKSSEILIQLDSIARIEDPPIEEARILLKSEEVTALRSNTTPASIPKNIVGRVTNRFSQSEAKTSMEELEALAEIKRKNDLWQSLLAAQTALEEKSKPLLAVNQQVVEARGEAKERLAELTKKLPDRRIWPPSNQTPIAEDQSLGEVDRKREELKRRPAMSELVVRELERLAREYRLVAEHTQQIIDRVDQDQERIQEVEWQINSLKERWQSQLDPDNPIMREGVQQLLSQSDSRLAFIKQQYMQGTLSYEQVIRNLQLLYDEIFVAQVPIDEQNKVRLNEPHRRTEQP